MYRAVRRLAFLTQLNKTPVTGKMPLYENGLVIDRYFRSIPFLHANKFLLSIGLYVAVERSVSKMVIKLLKWPPSETGVFPADAKRSLELNMTPSAPSFQSLMESVKQAYNIVQADVELKLYFYDGFEVMPLLREEDLTFCFSRFKATYIDFLNHVDMNRLYIVESKKVHHPPGQKKRSSKASALPENIAKDSESHSPEIDQKLAFRVQKLFPNVQLLEHNKFKCQCGKIGALNGKRRLGNIKRHVNTTCRLRNSYVGRTMLDFFPKVEQLGDSESDVTSTEDTP